jgi:hypothetical protein
MATLQELESAIDTLLDHPFGVAQYQLVQRVGEKAYEAYVFGLCMRAVRELGVTPVLKGIFGQPVPFVFRGAPGAIHSPYRNYGYVEFSLNGQRFEIHAGVEYRGTSDMKHELDVSLMRAEDADTCRQNANDPGANSLIGGWECKFYAGTLDKALGRQFVGLVKDLGSNIRDRGLCSNATNQQLRLYFKPKDRPFPHFQLTPLEPANENIFVGQLAGSLKKMTAS